MIQLLTIIKKSEKEKSERNKINKIPRKNMKFFMPARTITPRQFVKKMRRVPRERDLTSACYTHTTSYLGTCFIFCNNEVVARCGN